MLLTTYYPSVLVCSSLLGKESKYLLNKIILLLLGVLSGQRVYTVFLIPMRFLKEMKFCTIPTWKRTCFLHRNSILGVT